MRPATLGHPAGRTTARLTVHVVDSLAMTGHGYEASFDSLPNKTAALNVRDLVTGDTVVAHFPIDRGENVFYLSPVFAGLAVEVVPEFDLDLDLQSSYTHPAQRQRTSPLRSTLLLPGTKKVAPIDVALIWGSTDTLADGSYATVLDTALGINGKREVLVPFTRVEPDRQPEDGPAGDRQSCEQALECRREDHLPDAAGVPDDGDEHTRRGPSHRPVRVP